LESKRSYFERHLSAKAQEASITLFILEAFYLHFIPIITLTHQVRPHWVLVKVCIQIIKRNAVSLIGENYAFELGKGEAWIFEHLILKLDALCNLRDLKPVCLRGLLLKRIDRGLILPDLSVGLAGPHVKLRLVP